MSACSKSLFVFFFAVISSSNIFATESVEERRARMRQEPKVSQLLANTDAVNLQLKTTVQRYSQMLQRFNSQKMDAIVTGTKRNHVVYSIGLILNLLVVGGTTYSVAAETGSDVATLAAGLLTASITSVITALFYKSYPDSSSPDLSFIERNQEWLQERINSYILASTKVLRYEDQIQALLDQLMDIETDLSERYQFNQKIIENLYPTKTKTPKKKRLKENLTIISNHIFFLRGLLQIYELKANLASTFGDMLKWKEQITDPSYQARCRYLLRQFVYPQQATVSQ